MMLEEAICEAGTNAVLKYREISGSRQDNEVHETYLSSLLATNLFSRWSGVRVHAEVPYTRIADDLGIPSAITVPVHSTLTGRCQT